MGVPETHFTWSFTSTGTGQIFDARGFAQSLTWGIETSSGCTATVQLLHRMGSSAGPMSVMHSTAMSTGLFVTAQMLGPLEFLAPRVTDKTANSTNVVTVYLKGN